MQNKAFFFLLILISSLLSCSKLTPESVDLRFFTEVLEKRQVEKMTVINEKELFFDTKNNNGDISEYRMELPPEFNIVEFVDETYNKLDIPKNKQIKVNFESRENWFAPLLASVLPLALSGIFIIISLIVMLQREERYQYYKIIWAIIIIFAPLGWLIFLGMEFLLPKFTNINSNNDDS